MTSLFRGAILGAPGSGKGTISSQIIKTFDVIHVSTGDIFRQNLAEGTPLGECVQKYIAKGDLVPDILVMKIILAKLEELRGKNWLCDGFPRTLVQAEKLFTSYPLNIVINLKVPFPVIVDRIKHRWVHIPSGRVYNTDFKPPKIEGKDDDTGEPLVQRPDDKPEAILERLNVYATTTEPLLEYYKQKGILREFSGNTSYEIWPKIEKVLLEYLKPRS